MTITKARFSRPPTKPISDATSAATSSTIPTPVPAPSSLRQWRRSPLDFVAADLQELIHWADLIDGAVFPSAQAAVELKEPAMRLMLEIETTRDRRLLHKIIGLMQHNPLDAVLNEPEVKSTFEAMYENHIRSIDVMRERAKCIDGVIEFDISDKNLDGYNKFIPYYLFPDSVYCVGVSRSTSRAKVSVGTNPWTTKERKHNLARLCEQYGGGGHAVVAAISFKPEDLESARAAAREIAQKLRSA